MDIHNTNEDIVFNSVQTIFAEIQKGKNPEGFCLCEQCRMDTICYALNRIDPHYIVSNRGITRMDHDGVKRQQSEADIATLIYKGIRLVSHNQRPTAPHDGTVTEALDIDKPTFDIPTIVGRLFNGVSFAPITDITIELRCKGELVPMRNRNWQNPYTVFSSTPGAFTFWPAPVIADATDINRVFEYSIKVDSPDYEPYVHFFSIPCVSKLLTSYSYSLNRTYKLPDLYIFPPGEAEQNG
ncbi:MAG: late competence development ComFB family protein [Treponema sp.]|nr:late competence development ComFB family protein [Treponema sp.]